MQRSTKAGCGVLVVALFLLSGGMLGCHPSHVQGITDDVSPFAVRQTGLLAPSDLVEASGVVASRREAGLLWMINDGGHPPALYALQTDGKEAGRVMVRGALNTDWEDLAGFERNGRSFILIADVGDNRAVRSSSRIYVVEEPSRNGAGRLPAYVEVAWTVDFRYAEGPRDCEGVAVDPRAGQMLLVTKRTQPPQIYTLPLQPPEDGSVQTARRVGEMPLIPPPTAQDRIVHPRMGAVFSQPTALDIRSDNRLAVVLTYKNAYLFSRTPGATWAACLEGKPATVALPALKQKEAVCFGRNGRTIYITTEQRPAPLLEVVLPSRY